MKYRNITTGYIISTDCKIKADNWEAIPDQPILSADNEEVAPEQLDEDVPQQEEPQQEEPQQDVEVKKRTSKKGNKDE